MGRQKSKRQGGQVAPSRLPVGIQPAPTCTKVCPACTKVCPACTKVCPTIEKVWTESPPVQDIQTLPDFKARMDAPWVATTRGKKNMARYAEEEEGKNKGYCCGQADMCLAQPVQNTDTDELISWTTKLSIQFISTFTRSQN